MRLWILISCIHAREQVPVAREMADDVIVDAVFALEARPCPHQPAIAGRVAIIGDQLVEAAGAAALQAFKVTGDPWQVSKRLTRGDSGRQAWVSHRRQHIAVRLVRQRGAVEQLERNVAAAGISWRQL